MPLRETRRAICARSGQACSDTWRKVVLQETPKTLRLDGRHLPVMRADRGALRASRAEIVQQLDDRGCSVRLYLPLEKPIADRSSQSLQRYVPLVVTPMHVRNRPCMRTVPAVKEEIFFTDVTTCYNSLKKAVHELSAFSANSAELQMGQPSLRYVHPLRWSTLSDACMRSAEALTLTADPGAAFGLNFDRIFVVRVRRCCGLMFLLQPFDRPPRHGMIKRRKVREPPLPRDLGMGPHRSCQTRRAKTVQTTTSTRALRSPNLSESRRRVSLLCRPRLSKDERCIL